MVKKPTAPTQIAAKGEDGDAKNDDGDNNAEANTNN